MDFAEYGWLLGALCALIGSLCSNFGVNIQKYSFMQNELLPIEEQQSYSKQPKWMLGLFLVFIGSLGDFVALGLAAQSIVAPIGSVTLVSNIFFAYFWLKEELTKVDIMGTVFIIGGSTLAVIFGDHSTEEYTLADLLNYYTGTGFIIYAIVCVLLMLGAYIYLLIIEELKLKVISLSAEYELTLLQGRTKHLIILDKKIATAERNYAPHAKTHPLCYCIIAGTMGAQNILFGKSVAELLETTMTGTNQMLYPMTYVLLFCMFGSIFCQLHFLAKALQYFDAMYVVPVFQCFWISVSTVAGAAYFQEFSSFSTLQAVCFSVGLGMTLFGVYIMSARKMKTIIDSDRADATHIDIWEKTSRNPTMCPVNPFQAAKNRKYGLTPLEEEDDDDYDHVIGVDGPYESIAETERGRAESVMIKPSSVFMESEQMVEEVIVLLGGGDGYIVYVPKVATREQRQKLLDEAKERHEIKIHSHDDKQKEYQQQDTASTSTTTDNDNTRSKRAKSKPQEGATPQKSQYARMRFASQSDHTYNKDDLKVAPSTPSKKPRGESIDSLLSPTRKNTDAFMNAPNMPLLNNLAMVGAAEGLLIDAWDKLPSLKLPKFLQQRQDNDDDEDDLVVEDDI